MDPNKYGECSKSLDKIRLTDTGESPKKNKFVYDLEEVEQEGVDSLDIQDTLRELRRHRMGLIQTPDQLRFCYQAVIEGTRRLNPNYKGDNEIDDIIYNVVGEEEAPPPPPPRAESLTRAPARPLPAIPTSESLGNLNLSAPQETSSSDESPPTRRVRDSTTSVTTSSSSADDEDDEPTVTSLAESFRETSETLLRRRHRDLAERVSMMKKRAQETERWHSLKRSLYKRLTITFGFILAGIIIYSYVKH